MGPDPDTCAGLIRPARALLELKHAVSHHLEQDEHALHPAAVGLLAELTSRGECRASDLAQHRVVDASVVSRQVGQLERSGLITRRPDPTDRRVSLLTVTDEGEQALDKARRRRSEWLSNALRDWSDDQVRELSDSLDQLAEDIRRSMHEQLGISGWASQHHRPNAAGSDRSRGVTDDSEGVR